MCKTAKKGKEPQTKECSQKKIEQLEKMAHQVREDLIGMFRGAGKGHAGGSLSAVDVIVALYFHIMKVDPKNPDWPDRDRFVLSKGHSSAAWYAALAEKGYFPKDLLFNEFIKINGLLQEHAEMRKIPGVEMSSGALGQGLSVGLGMTLAGTLAKKDYKVYVMLGDGEMQSGQIWEALMAGTHHKASNLTAIIDYNNLQVSGEVNDVMQIEPLAQRLEAFGWNVLEIDGHDMSQIVDALSKSRDNTSSAPTVIISKTIKGKGIDFIENKVEWHSKAFSEDDYQTAKQILKDSQSEK